jgi:hypothetical protein
MKKPWSMAMVRTTGRGRPYPAEHRARAVEYARARRSEGIGVDRIACELGLARGTLEKWLRRGDFVAVEIVEPNPIERGHWDVHGPRGLRIEGVSLDEVVELWRRLA